MISEISIQTGYDKMTISNVIEAFGTTVIRTVSGGDSVFMRGFGSFTTKTRRSKVARNILKNETVIVPEHQIPYFKPSPEFKEALRPEK